MSISIYLVVVVVRVSYRNDGNSRHFSAENPENIDLFLERRQIRRKFQFENRRNFVGNQLLTDCSAWKWQISFREHCTSELNRFPYFRRFLRRWSRHLESILDERRKSTRNERFSQRTFFQSVFDQIKRRSIFDRTARIQIFSLDENFTAWKRSFSRLVENARRFYQFLCSVSANESTEC